MERGVRITSSVRGGGAAVNDGSTNNLTFTGHGAPASASALVLKNGSSIATITASNSGVFSYTFGSPVLSTDSVAFAVITNATGGTAGSFPLDTGSMVAVLI